MNSSALIVEVVNHAARAGQLPEEVLLHPAEFAELKQETRIVSTLTGDAAGTTSITDEKGVTLEILTSIKVKDEMTLLLGIRGEEIPVTVGLFMDRGEVRCVPRGQP